MRRGTDAGRKRMITAIYIRNSTNEERQNPETQAWPLKEFCNSKGWEYTIFQEFASGAKESRPELDKLLKGVRARTYKRVLVWRLDRLGRSLKHLLQLIEEFRNRDVEFVSLSEGFDTSTAQGELFFSIAGAFAQFERRLIQERVNAGLARAKAEGKQLGRPKGAKDKNKRRRSGYWARWQGKKTTPLKKVKIALEKAESK